MTTKISSFMNELNHKKTLLIGIGNSGRTDDGLGWAFVESIDDSGHFEGDCTLRYQLQIEDAELISRYDHVIFVDAYNGKLVDGFNWKACLPAHDFSFSTHELSPETVLFLCLDLYDKKPEAHILCIQGDQWDLQVGLCAKARKNLQNALRFFQEILSLSPTAVLS